MKHPITRLERRSNRELARNRHRKILWIHASYWDHRWSTRAAERGTPATSREEYAAKDLGWLRGGKKYATTSNYYKKVRKESRKYKRKARLALSLPVIEYYQELEDVAVTSRMVTKKVTTGSSGSRDLSMCA